MGAQLPGGPRRRARASDAASSASRAEELGDDDKVEVAARLSPALEVRGRAFFDGVSADSSDDELRRIAPEHPVFRITTHARPRRRRGLRHLAAHRQPFRHPGVPRRGGRRGRGARCARHLGRRARRDLRALRLELSLRRGRPERPSRPARACSNPSPPSPSWPGSRPRVRLGTAMCLLPQRNPVYTAKEVATRRLAVGGTGRPRRRRGMAARGVRGRRRCRGSGAGQRTDEYLAGPARAVVRRPVVVLGCVLHARRPATCIPSRSRTRILRSTSAARATPPCAARRAPGRAGTPSTAPPRTCRPPSSKLDALLAEEGRSRQDI